jgi:hypothetical protein
MNYVTNVWLNTRNRPIVFIVSRFILTQVMMANNGFYAINAAGGFTVNAQIMTRRMIAISNVYSARKAILPSTMCHW